MRTRAKILRNIGAERARQIAEGWDTKHDDRYESDGALGMAAACYAAPEPIFLRIPCGEYHSAWPWDKDTRNRYSRIRQLEVAAALIVAEIERLERRRVG